MNAWSRPLAVLAAAIVVMALLPSATPTLLAQAAVSGVVELPSGGFADGATVWYAPLAADGSYDERREEFGAVSDFYGNFTLPALPPGRYGLVVEPPPLREDAAMLRGTTFQIVSATPPTLPTLRLPAAVKRIIGAVILNGSPIGGVHVFASGPTSIWPRSAITGSDGRFAFGVESGTWEVTVAPPPGAPYEYSGGPALPRFATGTTVETANLTFALTPFSAQVVGTVLGDDQNPLPGIAVSLSSAGGGLRTASTISDGSFSFSVAPGAYELSVEPDVTLGYTTLEPTTRLDAIAGAPVSRTITLVPGAIISGTFTLDGSPSNSVRGLVYARDGAGRIAATSFADGPFELVLPEGSYSIGVEPAPDSPYLAAGEVSLSVPAVTPGSPPTLPVTLALRSANAAIGGVLRGPAGQILTGVDAIVVAAPPDPALAPRWAEVDESTGAYTLSVSPGLWSLSVEIGPGEPFVAPRTPVAASVAAGATAIQDLGLLQIDGVILGRVLDEQDAPVAGQLIWVGNDLYETTAVSDADGSFRFAVPLRNGAPTDYAIGSDLSCISLASCYLDPPPDTVTALPAGGVTSRLTQVNVHNVRAVRPRSETRLVGRVRRGNSNVGNATVNLALSTSGITSPSTSDETDGNGEFTFTLLYSTAQGAVSGRLSAGTTGGETGSNRFTRLALPSATSRAALAQIETVSLALAPVPGMPAPVAETFNPAVGWSTVLSDGARIAIPPGAVSLRANEGERALAVVTPVVNLVDSTQFSRAVTYGYTVAVRASSSNRPINERLALPAQVTLPYLPSDLDRNAARPATARPAVFSAGVWQPADSFRLDPAGRTYSFQLSTLGTVALVRPQLACEGCVYLLIVRSIGALPRPT